MIYFVRHGISEANKRGVYAGSGDDSKLTADGAQQMANLAQQCQDLNISTIFVSNLRRSVESGEILASLLSPVPTIVKDARTNELNFGKLVGQSYIDFDNDAAYKRYGIESKKAFYKRALDFYNEKLQGEPNKNVLIVGHSGFGMMLYAIINQLDYELYNKAFSPQAGKVYSLNK